MNSGKFYDDLFRIDQIANGVSQDLAQALKLWEAGNYWGAIAKLQQANIDATRLREGVQTANDRIFVTLGNV